MLKGVMAMNEKQSSIDWSFWRRWVLSSTLGYSIGGVLGWWTFLLMGILLVSLSMWPLLDSPLAMAAGMALGGAVVGAIVGQVQWKAVRLKTSYDDVMLWMTANFVTMAISWALAFWGAFPGDESGGLKYSLLLAGAFWGVLSAAIQWYFLGEQVRHAAIWVIANSLCGMFVFVLGWGWTLISLEVYGFVDEYTAIFHTIIGTFISWPIAGLLYGLVTGTLLAWLLREPKQPVGLDEDVLAG